MALGCQHVCATHQLEYHLNQGPWYYSKPSKGKIPSPSSPDWYRCEGGCHSFSTWSGVLGEILFPAYKWWVAWQWKTDRDELSHSAAIGFEDGKPRLVFDILWRPEPSLSGLERTYWNNKLAEYVLDFLGGPENELKCASVSDAIDILQEDIKRKLAA